MAQVSRLSEQIEIKSRVDVFYGFLKQKVPQLPQVYPEAITGFKFLEGHEVQDGAVVYWEYVLDGCTLKAKNKVEVSEPCKSINFAVTEGDVLKLYNSVAYKFQVNSGHVTVSVEFEKASKNSPCPNGYISMMSEIVKRLDAACLCSA